MPIHEITSKAQFEKMLEADGPVLVELGARWCEGCQYLKHNVFPGLNASAHGGLTIASVNLKVGGKVSKNEGDEKNSGGEVLHWRKKHSNQEESSPSPYMAAIPILVLFKGGEEVARMDYHYLEKQHAKGWTKEVIQKWLGEHGVNLPSHHATLEHEETIQMAQGLQKKADKIPTGEQHKAGMGAVQSAQNISTGGTALNIAKPHTGEKQV